MGIAAVVATTNEPLEHNTGTIIAMKFSDYQTIYGAFRRVLELLTSVLIHSLWQLVTTRSCVRWGSKRPC